MSKDEARNRLLEAAGQVFAEKGYDAATVREICQQADVQNIAAVNYYFGGKQRLYIEAVKWAHEPPGEMEKIQWPDGTPAPTKLTAYIAEMVRRMLSERLPWKRQLVMREILNPTEACRELVQIHFRARFDALLEILDEMLPPETPQYKRDQIGLSIVGQVVYYYTAGEIVTLMVGESERSTHFQADQLAEHIAQFTLAALGQAPPLPTTSCSSNDEPKEQSSAPTVEQSERLTE